MLERIKQLKAEGYSTHQVAKMLGMSPSTVYYRLNPKKYREQKQTSRGRKRKGGMGNRRKWVAYLDKTNKGVLTDDELMMAL